SKSRSVWISINWDRVSAHTQEGERTPLGPADSSDVISTEQAWEATSRILDQKTSGTFTVSPSPLHDRIDKWVHPTSQTRSPAGTEAGSGSLKPRPELTNEYVPPQTNVEVTVVKIWEEMLGIEGIGINDNFFALGGHSLLAIQIIGRLREAFPIEIEIRHLITENPTPSSIAAAIENELPQEEELDEMARLVSEVQQLSPEEARSKLKE
ncbi:MAG: phosphopantetheine-binding protein, partial [Verrucomicrobiota bacterium]